MAESPVVLVDLSGRCFLGRAPGSCQDAVDQVPGSREVQVPDILEQLESARCRRQVVLLRVDCWGGFLTAAAEVWAALRAARSAGQRVVAHVAGQAASAGALLPLGADYVTVDPDGVFVLHAGSPAPAGAPRAPAPSSLEKVLAEADASATYPLFELNLLLTETLASVAEVIAWITSDRTVITATKAVAVGFADEIGPFSRALEVASALARGAVHSPRRAALAALGRGDLALAEPARPLPGRT